MTIVSRGIRHLAVAVIANSSLFSAQPALAAGPDGPVLLELVPPDGGESVRLTREDLEALPQTGFETTTTWTGGKITFSGPLLADVVALADLTGETLRAFAENEYSVLIPPEVIGKDAPIVALRMNGQPFSRRQLGPLWIVFPYDFDPAYRSEAIYAMSIWQLDRIQQDPG